MTTPQPSSAGPLARTAVLAALAQGALVAPGLPVELRAALAMALAGAAAVWLAQDGRSRLQSAENRFQPPDPATLLRAPPPAARQLASGPAEAPVTPGHAPPVLAPPLQPNQAPAAPAPPTAAWQGHPTATAVVAGRGPGEPVYLGPQADPAFPSWQLHWQLPDGRTGIVPLPLGDRITLGRQPDCHVVVAMSEVSRVHLLLQVASAGVAAVETGTSNGTWLRKGEGIWARLTPQQPAALAAWDQLRIAEPWAIVLTLEPAARG